ncbi:MAG: hypothetical protein ABL985_21440 [Casimicrobium sp.]
MTIFQRTLSTWLAASTKPSKRARSWLQKRLDSEMKAIAHACVLAVLLLPATAQAKPVNEVGLRAVLEHCPRLFESETDILEDRKLIADGFTKDLGERPHPRVGKLRTLEATLDNGSVAIGVSDEAALCSVVLDGPGAEQTFTAIRRSINQLADGLVTDTEAVAPKIPGLEIETLRTTATDGMYLGVQFVRTTPAASNPIFIVQQYWLEE